MVLARWLPRRYERRFCLPRVRRTARFLHASEYHFLLPPTSAPHPGHVRGPGYSTTASSSSSAGIGVSDSRLLSLPIRTIPLGAKCRGESSPRVHGWHGCPSGARALASGCRR